MIHIRQLLFGMLISVLLAACTETPVNTPQSLPTYLPEMAQPTVTAQSVDMGGRQPYTHPSKLFRLDVPQQWQVQDSSTSSEIVVHFADRAQNAAIQTNLLTVTQQLDSVALTALLQTYLTKTYGGNLAFSQQSGDMEPDHSIAATWSYNTVLASGSTARMHGTSVIRQRGACVSVLSFVVPEQQYPALVAQIAAIRASYQLTAVDSPHAVAADGPLFQTHMDDLQPYTHAGALFTLKVPAGWTLQDRSAPGKASLLWTDVSGNAWLMVDVFQVDSQRSDKERAALLRDLLTAAFGKQNDFALGVPETQDGRTRVVWTYRASADNGTAPRLQGTSYIEQRGDKVAITTVTLPASEAAALRGPSAAIIDSFVLDEAAPLA